MIVEENWRNCHGKQTGRFRYVNNERRKKLKGKILLIKDAEVTRKVVVRVKEQKGSKLAIRFLELTGVRQNCQI